MGIIGNNGILSYVKSIVDLIKPETDKIDTDASDGLSGVYNSLSYRVEELEKHFHNRERWFGVAGTPSDTHKADRIGTTGTPFTLTSGASTWGAWVQVLGSADTPQQSGAEYFDPHRAVVISTDMVGAHFFQMASGPDADAAITSGTYSEFTYASASNQIDVGTIDIMSPRQPANTEIWVRMMTPGFTGKVLTFFFGIHEYEG